MSYRGALPTGQDELNSLCYATITCVLRILTIAELVVLPSSGAADVVAVAVLPLNLSRRSLLIITMTLSTNALASPAADLETPRPSALLLMLFIVFDRIDVTIASFG